MDNVITLRLVTTGDASVTARLHEIITLCTAHKIIIEKNTLTCFIHRTQICLVIQNNLF